MKTKNGKKLVFIEIKSLLVRSILRYKNKWRLMRVTGPRIPSRVGKWYIREEREAGKEKGGALITFPLRMLSEETSGKNLERSQKAVLTSLLGSPTQRLNLYGCHVARDDQCRAGDPDQLQEAGDLEVLCQPHRQRAT